MCKICLEHQFVPGATILVTGRICDMFTETGGHGCRSYSHIYEVKVHVEHQVHYVSGWGHCYMPYMDMGQAASHLESRVGLVGEVGDAFPRKCGPCAHLSSCPLWIWIFNAPRTLPACGAGWWGSRLAPSCSKNRCRRWICKTLHSARAAHEVRRCMGFFLSYHATDRRLGCALTTSLTSDAGAQTHTCTRGEGRVRWVGNWWNNVCKWAQTFTIGLVSSLKGR